MFREIRVRRWRGSHGDGYKNGCLLGCSAVWTGVSLTAFHRSVLRSIVLTMEAVRTSETSVNLYQSTRRYNPEDGHLTRKSFRRETANYIFSICFQLLHASSTVPVYAFYNTLQRKSEYVRSVDPDGHNLCEMILSLKNSFSIPMASLTV
jgi:hypothetical protein